MLARHPNMVFKDYTAADFQDSDYDDDDNEDAKVDAAL